MKKRSYIRDLLASIPKGKANLIRFQFTIEWDVEKFVQICTEPFNLEITIWRMRACFLCYYIIIIWSEDEKMRKKKIP